MSEVALAVPLEDERRLVSTAGRSGHTVVARCSGGDELAGRLGALAPDAVIAAADPQYLTERLVAACDAAGVRLIVVADATGRPHARRLGIVDVAEGPVDWAVLAAPVPSGPPPALAPTGRQEGRVVAVWGPAGAPGRTSIAIALAAELAATGRSTALADADVHAASVAPALGLLDEAPGFAAACRLAGLGALDAGELDRVAQAVRVRGGALRVLTGLSQPRRWPELAADRVADTVAALRAWVDVVVLDVAASLEADEELSSDLAAPRRNAATLAALGAADHVVVVGSADAIGLSRLLRAHAELLERIDPPSVTVLVNRVRASAIGLNPQGQVRQTLLRFGGIENPVLVPLDVAAFDAALLGGLPLSEAAPRSAARLALRELVAERLVPHPSAVGAAR